MGGSIPARLEPLELRDSRRVALLHPPPPPHALQPQRRQGQGPGTMPAMLEFSACCPSRCSATWSRRCSVLKHPECSFLSLIVSSRRTCAQQRGRQLQEILIWWLHDSLELELFKLELRVQSSTDYDDCFCIYSIFCCSPMPHS